MYLMYYLNAEGDRVYTLKVRFSSIKKNRHYNIFALSLKNFVIHRKLIHQAILRYLHTLVNCLILNYYPLNYIIGPIKFYAPLILARFSPEDKYSRERITLKRRFGLLLTQQPMPSY